MSRPPLPRGLPPRPDGPAYRPNHDGYRPNNDTYRPRNDNYAPPQHQRQSAPVYHFQGSSRDSWSGHEHFDQRSPSSYDRYTGSIHNDTYAPSVDSYRPREQEFSFRRAAPPNLDYNQRRNDYRPRSRSRSPPRHNGYHPGSSSRDNRRDRHPQRFQPNQRGGTRGGGYHGRGPRLASDRAFLKTNRAPTPELMPGMDEEAGTVRFRDVDDMSDSDEAEMDMSDDDDADAAQPKKKVPRTEMKAADGDSVPKWSNPDPYTALPPPDETQRKKKDVVKLIRKARVANTSENTAKAAESDDFISFDFGDDQAVEGSTDEAGNGVPGAPSGPRDYQAQTSYIPPARDVGYIQQQNGHPDGSSTTDSGIHRQQTKIQIELNKPPPKAPRKAAAKIDLTPDPSLGNRKRNIRDEIQGPPVIPGPSGPGPASNGKVTSVWKSKPNIPPTPWIEVDHSKTANMGLWLHKEIMDFYHFVKPRDFEQRIRTDLVNDLRAIVRKEFGADIRTFGSFPAGLYLPTSDMDLVCVSDAYLERDQKVLCQNSRSMFRFAGFLKQRNIPLPGSVEVIHKAKVPIIKYVDKLTGLKVDISFENDTGLIANKTFQDWKTEFPAMPILVTLVKHVLAMRGLNEPANGGIGGFSTICLVVSLLQHMPQVQSRNMVPEHHLGEILMEFLDLYGNQFNTTTTAICMKPPRYLSKNSVPGVAYKGKANKLSIIDPNRSTNDISAGATNTDRILECFSKAYRDLQNRMGELQNSSKRSKASILDCILGGDYTSFDLQRKHLAHVHEKLVGPIEEEF